MCSRRRPRPITHVRAQASTDVAGEQGVAIVEFALIVPVLVMLLLGIATSGSAYNQKLSIAHAAREGSRYAARVSPDQTFSSGTWASNVRDLLKARAGGELDDESDTICVALVRGATATTYAGAQSPSWYSTKADASPCVAPDPYAVTTNDDGLRVQVVVTHPVRLEFGMFSTIAMLRNSVVMQSEYAS